MQQKRDFPAALGCAPVQVEASRESLWSVPGATLFPTLDVLGKQLHEFPRCQRLLLAAEIALADKKNSATDPELTP
ncbi:hypothetical protein [Mycobacterium sp.]|uniref:hypothetical protein n=1 Tax=Mycobacterium sp. TaxID=1785 RepID=UPI003D10B39B